MRTATRVLPVSFVAALALATAPGALAQTAPTGSGQTTEGRWAGSSLTVPQSISQPGVHVRADFHRSSTLIGNQISDVAATDVDAATVDCDDRRFTGLLAREVVRRLVAQAVDLAGHAFELQQTAGHI